MSDHRGSRSAKASRWRFRPEPALARKDEVRRLRHYLLQSSYPRLQMCLLVVLTSAAGLLASLLLLSGGMTTMALRYPLAVSMAYLVFLGLLWLWMRTTWDEYVDLPDVGNLIPTRRNEACHSNAQTNAGRETFAGDYPNSAADAGGGVLDSIDVVAVDEFVIPLALLAVLVAVCASLVVVLVSVVWSAPALFAELLFDGVLAAGLYRRLRRADAQHWLQAALRHTFWPFVLAAVFAAAAGFALQYFVPGATTLSQALAR